MKKQACTVMISKQLGSAWLHMCAVQRSNMTKGIPTKIAYSTVRSIAGAPPSFVGEVYGSGASLLDQNTTYFIYTKTV
eukprot:7506706-Ditylum_brightwellii.AAC.1